MSHTPCMGLGGGGGGGGGGDMFVRADFAQRRLAKVNLWSSMVVT